MRYEVVMIGEDPEANDEPYRYDVFEAGRGCIGSRYWIRAEAEIIAWALNAVHEGRGLLAHGHCECGEPNCWSDDEPLTYAGPTEGVA